MEAAEKGKKDEGETEKTQKGIHEKNVVLTETLKGKDEEDEIEKTKKGIHEEETSLKEAEKGENEKDGQEKTHKGTHKKEVILRETEEMKDKEIEIEKTQCVGRSPKSRITLILVTVPTWFIMVSVSKLSGSTRCIQLGNSAS